MEYLAFLKYKIFEDEAKCLALINSFSMNLLDTEEPDPNATIIVSIGNICCLGFCGLQSFSNIFIDPTVVIHPAFILHRPWCLSVHTVSPAPP